MRPLATVRVRSRPPSRGRHFDAALVEYIYESRFLIASQLQRRFPHWLPTARTAQRHVARLIAMKHLAVAPVRSTGPNFPAVLYATGHGIQLVRETYAGYGLDWSGPTTEEPKARGLALDSVLHEVLISELDLAIYRTIDSRDDLVLLDRERRYFRRDRELAYRHDGKHGRVVPDAGYLPAVRSAAGRRLLPLHLIELEQGTHTVGKIRKKLRAYQRWMEQSAAGDLRRLYAAHSEPHKRPTFRLLLIAHDKYGTVSDERRLLDLFVQAIEVPRKLRDSIWLATASDLRRHQHDPAPLAAPVWYRARDARKWLAEYRQFTRGERGRSFTRERSFVADRIDTLPRHPLFPRQEHGSLRHPVDPGRATHVPPA